MAEANDSSSTVHSKSSPTITLTSSSQQQQQRMNFLMAQDIFRILPTLLSAAAIALMVTNNQTIFIFSLQFQAHFYYFPSFKFFVAANGVVVATSLLTLLVNFLMKYQASPRYHFFILLHDITMTVLLVAGCAAATAVGYVAQYGEDHVGWQPICDRLRKFCTTNLLSLLLSYFSFIAYFGLTLLSPYKLFLSSSTNN